MERLTTNNGLYPKETQWLNNHVWRREFWTPSQHPPSKVRWAVPLKDHFLQAKVVYFIELSFTGLKMKRINNQAITVSINYISLILTSLNNRRRNSITNSKGRCVGRRANKEFPRLHLTWLNSLSNQWLVITARFFFASFLLSSPIEVRMERLNKRRWALFYSLFIPSHHKQRLLYLVCPPKPHPNIWLEVIILECHSSNTMLMGLCQPPPEVHHHKRIP